MNDEDLIGWASSLILLITLVHQVRAQWKSGESRGISPWLFAGQVVASVGFFAYSVLLRNWVFVVTNGLLVLNALVGQLIVVQHRRRGRTAEAGGHSA